MEPAGREVRTEEIGLRGIAIHPDRLRKLNPAVVKELAASMKEQGLLHPIILRPRGTIGFGYILVAGRHRLEAARKLKWPCIRAEIRDGMEAVAAELAEIDENLVRAELSPAERDLHLARRKELYEKKHPETKHGGNPGAGRGKAAPSQSSQIDHSVTRFTKQTAIKTGVSESTIKRSVARAKALGEDVLRQVVGTSLDKPEQLSALAQLDEAQREAPDLAGRRMRYPASASRAASHQAARSRRVHPMGAADAAGNEPKVGHRLTASSAGSPTGFRLYCNI